MFDLMLSPVMLSRIKKKTQNYLNISLKPYGIGGVHAVYIMELFFKGKLTLSELTFNLDLDKANTTRVISELEGKGIVVKEKKEGFVKKLKYYLTEKGKKVALKTKEVMRDWINILGEGITERNKLQFLRTMRIIMKNIDKV